MVATTPATETLAPFNALTFTFDEILDPDSANVASFTGPGAVNLLSKITGTSVSGTDMTVSFTDQVVAGTYTMVIGPTIRDRNGNVMDQDGDGIGGESEDVFTATVTVRSPDLVVDSLTVDPTSTEFGESVALTWVARNAGDAPAALGWVDRIWFSADNALDNDDTFLDEETIGSPDVPLDPGSTYTRRVSVDIPFDRTSADGTFFIIIEANAANDQFESEENNNEAAQSIILVAPALPDLVIDCVVLPDDPVVGDPAKVEVTWTVRNSGSGGGPFESWTDQIIFSDDSVVGDGDDVVVGTFLREGAVGPGESYTESLTVTLPAGLDRAACTALRSAPSRI